MAKKQITATGQVVTLDETAKAQGPKARVFTHTVEAFSDLFKLEVAKVIKNHGVHVSGKTPDTDPEDFKAWEHTHPFRTRDSDGKSLNTSASISGHFHVVETAPNPEGAELPPIILSCSGPMIMGRTKKNGKWVQSPIPLNDYDDHTHEVTYVQSHKIQAREINIEAAAVIARVAQKGAPIAGVTER